MIRDKIMHKRKCMNEQPLSLETNDFGALGYQRQGSLYATPTTTFGYQGRQPNGMIKKT